MGNSKLEGILVEKQLVVLLLEGDLMGFFKQKIYFLKFLAQHITYQFDFMEKNFDKLIGLADEFKVLTEQDKDFFLDKAHELIIVYIMGSCNQHFCKKLSSEEIGKAVSIMYGKYLTEYKKVLKTLAEKKVEKVIELLDLVCKAEEDIQKDEDCKKTIECKYYPKIDNDIDKQKFYLCRGFAEYCTGEDVKSENWEGKHFAAFKLAKGFSKGDFIANSLKDYTVTFR
ncbi:MAG TPA: hypothetical protein DDW84_01650 [Phycisphaerales bacterium]|nr:MAG: hypothetical protein A2Y13_00995 [Planctomycetes bacterium GWC2_45_44]HBG77541.1 hypothetical protein [Phycisphaerales bacterium]HBR19769.1 hypothetical protein [Phycisphaerales bacterium]